MAILAKILKVLLQLQCWKIFLLKHGVTEKWM